ncbi:MAG: hypothetical protein H7196_01310 [candidate division SR1 bacterium]|nr:hypothetical protein [candidate division SR1 bacterium]
MTVFVRPANVGVEIISDEFQIIYQKYPNKIWDGKTDAGKAATLYSKNLIMWRFFRDMEKSGISVQKLLQLDHSESYIHGIYTIYKSMLIEGEKVLSDVNTLQSNYANTKTRNTHMIYRVVKW